MIIILAALSLATGALETSVRQPIGKWAIDYGERACTLSRSYSEDQITLQIAVTPLSENMDVVLVAPTSLTKRSFGPATVEIVGKEKFDTVFVRKPSTSPNSSEFRLTLPAGFQSILDEQAVISLKLKGETVLPFELRQWSSATKALSACAESLLRHWSIDPDQVANIATAPSPVGDRSKWIGYYDYPTSAVANEQEGDSLILFNVDVNGRVTHCKSVHSSGVPELDAAACAAIMRRAKYRPALDINGNPAEASVVRQVLWRLPLW